MTAPHLPSNAVEIAASDRRLAWRAVETFAVVGAVMLLLQPWWAGLIGFGMFLAAGCARALLWRRKFGTRRLVSTPDYLAAVHRGRVQAWVRWDEITRLLVAPTDRMAGWSRSFTWLTVNTVPDVAVQPPSAFTAPLAELMVSRRDTGSVRARLEQEAGIHGVEVSLAREGRI